MAGQSKESDEERTPSDFHITEVNGPKGRRFHARNGAIFHFQKTNAT